MANFGACPGSAASFHARRTARRLAPLAEAGCGRAARSSSRPPSITARSVCILSRRGHERILSRYLMVTTRRRREEGTPGGASWHPHAQTKPSAPTFNAPQTPPRPTCPYCTAFKQLCDRHTFSPERQSISLAIASTHRPVAGPRLSSRERHASVSLLDARVRSITTNLERIQECPLRAPARGETAI